MAKSEEELQEMLDAQKRDGKTTGNYPEGKLSTDDEGEIAVGFAADKEKNLVYIEFGKPVAWLAFPKKLALEMAETLKKKAEELE